ncbi:MAG: T9SS type A sorting domain-containing protein [Chlorobi bacterium]|nr:T9SS type A sorting domain-containing protein [Chlorobiota bacterium]
MKSLSYGARTRTSFVNLKLFILIVVLLLLYGAVALAQTTYYIDPTAGNGGDGSIGNPFDSWSDITISSNTTYLQKRGTVENRTSSMIYIYAELNNITFGAYGTGDRPQVTFTQGVQGVYIKYTHNITIKDLELIGNYGYNGVFGQDAIHISSDPVTGINLTNTTIQNCKIHRWGSGIVVQQFNQGGIVDGFMIDGCEIFDIGLDGIFGGIENVTIQNCNLYRINRRWHTVGHTNADAGGDAIQVHGMDYLIQNNIIDRSWTGNKFCIIIGAVSYKPYRGKILNNTIIPPKDSIGGDGGACIYISESGLHEISYNKFLGRGFSSAESTVSLMHFRADSLDFNYNLIDSVNIINIAGTSQNRITNFYNNTFVGQSSTLILTGISGDMAFKNNIMALQAGVNPIALTGTTVLDSTNNILVNGNSATWNVNPGFVDWGNGDFGITGTSPAKDAGYTYPGYTVDLAGNNIQGVRDIGAYEYIPAPGPGMNYYINPLNTNDPLEDGSLGHPFDTWADVVIQDNSSYFQLRGTSDTVSAPISLYRNINIEFGAYGPGDILPVIAFDNGGTGSELFSIGACNNITIDSLHLSGEPSFPDALIKVAGDWQIGGWDMDGLTVTNCELHHGNWNVFMVEAATTFKNISILNSEIHHSYDDALYFDHGDMVEVGYCNIYSANQKYFDDPANAGGDGIQFNGTKTAHVHNCVVDRGDTGNNFCVIYNEAGGYTDGWITIENNTLTTPIASGNGGAGVFLKQCPGAIVRYNEIKSNPAQGGVTGIYAQNDTLISHYNIFRNLPEAIMSGNTDYTEVYNCVFYENEGMDVNGNGGGFLGMKNNIFFYYPGKSNMSVYNNNITDFESDYNNYNYQYSQMLTGVTLGANSMVSDPGFIENGVNFRLSASSPCLNTGTDLNIPIDIDSTAVPQGTGPELGSFEFIEETNNMPNIADQGFQLDENSANGQIVGTVVASDPDAGQVLTYSITNGNTGNTFAINSTNGELTVANNSLLDFESNPYFSLTVQVQDNGTGNLTNQATITVDLNDINENPDISTASFTINENSANGTAVGTVSASDPDTGQTLSFSIIAGNTSGAFQINPNSGAISVANSSALNYESNPTYSLMVEVEDNGTGSLTDQATITINLNDVNESPDITSASFSINENSANGTAVGTVSASDPDTGQTLSFSIIGGNTSGAFQINSNTGEISVAYGTVLNYESNPVFSLLVQVQDNGSGSLTDQATITVNLIDVNENPNIANQNFNISESIGNGDLVGTLIATDPDAGQTLSFAIIAGNTDNAFQLNSSTGELTVANSTAIDVEINPNFYLIVEVEDNGTGNLSDVATITVSITDVNEMPNIADQVFSVDENSSNGEQIGVVLASDPDVGQTLTYSIIGGNTDNAFQINMSNGVLSVDNSGALNFEVTPVFDLIVQVQDNGPGNLTNQADITVSLLDMNDSPEMPDQAFYVDENSANGQVVGTVTASDEDAGQTLSFTIISGNADGAFQMSTAGVMTVADASVLDFEINAVFDLVVEVEDNGTGNLTDQAMVTVHVNDVNEAPSMADQGFSESIDISLILDGDIAFNYVILGTILSTDPDVGQGHTYSIVGGNETSIFEVEAVTGVLTVIDPYQLTAGLNKFFLTAQVYDNTPEQYTATAVITVMINMTDDNNSSNSGEEYLDIATQGVNGFDCSLYPNPTTSSLNVDVDRIIDEKLIVGIYSAAGALMFEEEFTGNSINLLNEFDVSRLSKGVYIVNVISGDKRIFKKFIKQ